MWAFLSMEIYEIQPAFSLQLQRDNIEQACLIVCHCSLPLFRLLIVTAEFVVENYEK